jgi:glycosyltransferase involved in cell wall biosynthesis
LSRIALVIPTVDRLGGAEQQVLLLAKGLARRNWRVTVIALSGTGGVLPMELSFDGVDFLSLEMRKGLADPRGWWRFHRWFSQNKPDIVHAHLPHAAWFVRWSHLWDSGCAVVDTVHTAATGTLGRKAGYRLSDWLADRVTAVSAEAGQAYVAAGTVSRKHVVVLPNGIDTQTWQPDRTIRDVVRDELCLTDEFLWLAAGRLERVKDYPTLFRAFAAIRESAQLVIAGTGTLEPSLRRLANDLGIGKHVHFLGFVTGVRRWMQAADGFVLSSLWEGLPMGLLEAASCGLPAVATDVAGSREVILKDRTGFLATPSDRESLAAAMTRLAHMPKEARYAMGNCARQRVIERYDLERILDRWESLYGELRENPALRLWKQLRGA